MISRQSYKQGFLMRFNDLFYFIGMPILHYEIYGQLNLKIPSEEKNIVMIAKYFQFR